MTTRRPMGLHIQGAYDQAERYIRAVKPPVVKFLDDAPPHLVDLVHSYGGLTILRVYREDQDLGRFDEYLRDIERAARGSAVKAIEVSHNEAHQAGEELARKASLDIEGMKLAERLGKIGVIGCFSVGMPDLPEWPRYRSALEYAAARGHLLALHEYGGGELGMEAGLAQGPGGRLLGWYGLRYRRVLAWAASVGLRMPRIVITEAGIDDLSPAVLPKTRGYKTARDLHLPWVGDYATQAARYAHRLAEDAGAVLGWVDFGFGASDPQWGGFNLATDEAMLGRMIQEMQALPEPALKPPKEKPIMDIVAHLRSALGTRFTDMRGALPDVDGPHGRFGRRVLSMIRTIAVHHSAGPKAQTARQLYDFHIGPERGWGGLGYHILIRQGQVHLVGDPETARACVKDLNASVLCVCLTGDYTREALDDRDAEALAMTVGALQAWAQAQLGHRLSVKGHGELPGQQTACPGTNLLPLVRDLDKRSTTAPKPPTAGPNMAKVVWALEQATRVLEGEGLRAEAAHVATTYTAAAIKLRDGR